MRRRQFLVSISLGAALLSRGRSGTAWARQAAPQEPLAGQGPAGSLRDPDAAGEPRAPSTARDNDPFVVTVEHRLKCQCGCNLDVYTCRTTDFTCRTSPAMHRAVLALQDQGKTAQEIADAFVAKYGEQALMAPKPEGFNLAGYLVPGVLILTIGGLLAAFLSRRRSALAAAAMVSPPGTGGASTEDLERLKRALAELES